MRRTCSQDGTTPVSFIMVVAVLVACATNARRVNLPKTKNIDPTTTITTARARATISSHEVAFLDRTLFLRRRWPRCVVYKSSPQKSCTSTYREPRSPIRRARPAGRRGGGRRGQQLGNVTSGRGSGRERNNRPWGAVVFSRTRRRDRTPRYTPPPLPRCGTDRTAVPAAFSYTRARAIHV